ncbi:MAG: nucleotide exchange factor GrpE [bacterium]|nr:nucleotide exchange factor GrpE [Candidatus Margulisiibacteriota bacterium]
MSDKKNKKTSKTPHPDTPPLQDEYKDKYLRTLADFDNFKKQMAKQTELFAQFANENIIKEILPVLDNFGHALQAAKDNKEILDGLSLIKKQLEDVLKKHGAEVIEALGKPYDPNFHEAMVKKEHDGPEDIVIEEMRKGYILKGRVIRPSMVIVSQKKGE